jgi:threonine dehydrogenase-like Zn-dependent dehydrogenase
MTLRLRGMAVRLSSLEPPDHPRAKLAARAGAEYVAAPAEKADIVVEATGAPEAAFAAIRALGPLGVCALLGADAGSGHVSFRELVLGNRVVFGSVNASPAAFAQAIEDLGRFDPNILRSLIERRPFSDFQRSMADQSAGAAKITHVIR